MVGAGERGKEGGRARRVKGALWSSKTNWMDAFISVLRNTMTRGTEQTKVESRWQNGNRPSRGEWAETKPRSEEANKSDSICASEPGKDSGIGGSKWSWKQEGGLKVYRGGSQITAPLPQPPQTGPSQSWERQVCSLQKINWTAGSGPGYQVTAGGVGEMSVGTRISWRLPCSLGTQDSDWWSVPPSPPTDKSNSQSTKKTLQSWH